MEEFLAEFELYLSVYIITNAFTYSSPQINCTFTTRKNGLGGTHRRHNK